MDNLLERVLSKFERVQKSGNGFKARCPSHDDAINSLSIDEADDGNILIKCQAGCDTKSVIDAVGLSWGDLFGSNGNDQRRSNDPVTERYVYVDENSSPLFRVCRTRSKRFFQERFEADRWILRLNGVRRVLYQLPDVVKAESVYIVEGEKDVAKLQSIGLVATTNSGGASAKWEESYSATLKDKIVVIFPDNDGPGREHALKVARSVLPVARWVKVVALPDVGPKGDVTT